MVDRVANDYEHVIDYPLLSGGLCWRFNASNVARTIL